MDNNIVWEDESCDVCYKDFEMGQAIGFMLGKEKNAELKTILGLRPVHLEHVTSHMHENTMKTVPLN